VGKQKDEIQWHPDQRKYSITAHGSSGVSAHGKKREQTMPLLQILMVLIVVGVLLWLVNNFIPMAGSIKSILNAVVVAGVIFWLLSVFGFVRSLSHIHVGA
jgi:hypothetical protein